MTAEKINAYLSRVTSTEAENDGRRRLYHVGPAFVVEVSICQHDLSNRRDLMHVWTQAGYIPTPLSTSLDVRTYYTDKAGNCWGWYNITERPSEDGRRMVIDFGYMREATPDHERELVAECIRLAVEAGAIA